MNREQEILTGKIAKAQTIVDNLGNPDNLDWINQWNPQAVNLRLDSPDPLVVLTNLERVARIRTNLIGDFLPSSLEKLRERRTLERGPGGKYVLSIFGEEITTGSIRAAQILESLAITPLDARGLKTFIDETYTNDPITVNHIGVAMVEARKSLPKGIVIYQSSRKRTRNEPHPYTLGRLISPKDFKDFTHQEETPHNAEDLLERTEIFTREQAIIIATTISLKKGVNFYDWAGNSLFTFDIPVADREVIDPILTKLENLPTDPQYRQFTTEQRAKLRTRTLKEVSLLLEDRELLNRAFSQNKISEDMQLLLIWLSEQNDKLGRQLFKLLSLESAYISPYDSRRLTTLGTGKSYTRIPSDLALLIKPFLETPTEPIVDPKLLPQKPQIQIPMGSVDPSDADFDIDLPEASGDVFIAQKGADQYAKQPETAVGKPAKSTKPDSAQPTKIDRRTIGRNDPFIGQEVDRCFALLTDKGIQGSTSGANFNRLFQFAKAKFRENAGELGYIKTTNDKDPILELTDMVMLLLQHEQRLQLRSRDIADLKVIVQQRLDRLANQKASGK